MEFRITFMEGDGSVQHQYRQTHKAAEEFAQELFALKNPGEKIFVMLQCKRCGEWYGASASCCS